MTAAVRQLLGLAVAIVSFVGTITICALPNWRVAVRNDVQVYWGLWKHCVTFSTYPTSCTTYDGERILITPDLVGGRALIIIAIIVGVIGILLGAAGTNFITFVPDERKKSKMTMASGVVFLIAGFFVLISVCWITNTTTTGKVDIVPPDFSLKWDLGASVYIGWITTVLLFLGGGLLCSSFLCRDGTD